MPDVADIHRGDRHQHAYHDRMTADEKQHGRADDAGDGRRRRGANEIGVERSKPSRCADRGEERRNQNEDEDRIGQARCSFRNQRRERSMSVRI